MYQIRRAENRDIPAIMELLEQVCMVHHRARPDLFRGPATKYTPEELTAILADERTPVFVCTDGDGNVLGHAFCVLEDTRNSHVLTDIRSLYIDDICVHERMRGKHVGAALYSHVVDFARAQGCYNVTLNVWAGNDGAYQFYKAQGMKPQKTGMEVIL